MRGYGCVGVGMGHAGFLGKVGWRERAGRMILNHLFPCFCFCMRREEGEQLVFFLKKKNVI